MDQDGQGDAVLPGHNKPILSAKMMGKNGACDFRSGGGGDFFYSLSRIISATWFGGKKFSLLIFFFFFTWN